MEKDTASSLMEAKTGYDSSDSDPAQTDTTGHVDTSIFWESAANLENTGMLQGTEEKKALALAVGGTTQEITEVEISSTDSATQIELKARGISGIELAEQKGDQSYFGARIGNQSTQRDDRSTVNQRDDRSTTRFSRGGNPSNEDEVNDANSGSVPLPPRATTTTLAVKGGDLAKLVEASVKLSPIPPVRIKDETSYVKWLEGVNNLLSTVGLASLTMMNKYSSFLKNSEKLTELRSGILKGAKNTRIHPKFTKAVKEIQEGFYCDLIPPGEDEYSLNCRYYAMLFVYPNLERQVITTILPSIDVLIRDSLPDYRSTPDSLKITYGTVTRRFINENINVIDAREERVKKLTLATSADPAILAKQIREEVEIINAASHQVLVSPVRQMILLYNAVKRSPDVEHYRDTLKKYRELKQVGISTYAKFSQELHADYIRDVEQPEVTTRGNAAQEGGNKRQFSTPYAPPGYCFNFVKTGSCRDGDNCTYRHEEPPRGGRNVNKSNANQDRRDRRPQFNKGKKELIKAFVSALMESESEQSGSDTGNGSGDENRSSESDSGTIAMSTRGSKKKPKFPKRKGGKKDRELKRTDTNKPFSRSPNTEVSNKGKGGEKKSQPTKPHTTFQDTMKNLEKKYSKVELAKIAGIFSALDLGEDQNDSVDVDQSTSPGSESQ